MEKIIELSRSIISKECYLKFFADKNPDPECIKQTLSKAVGFAIVMGSSVLKLPQILKIAAEGSAEGLSSISVYIETVMYMNVSSAAIA